MSIKRYGATFLEPEAGVDPSATIELQMAFNPQLGKATGFLGRFEHLRRGIDLIWNEPRRRQAAERRQPYDERKNDAFIWNEWSEDMLEAFCEWHWATTIWGPNASWKTTSAGIYANAAFYASPSNTIIVLTTTTLPGLKKRIWKEVLKYYRWSDCGIGSVHASDFAIRFQKGSDEAGIFGIATGQDEGDIQKAVDKIIGFHAPNVIAVVDEMQATNEAIVKACLSLEAGAERFQLIGLGNPDSELDSLGQMSEPWLREENRSAGYDSVNLDTGRWETKRGICLHLHGLKSPRVKEGDEFYPGLLTQRDIDSAAKAYGEDSPEFWRTRHGFIAPQGVTKTVLSPALIKKGNAKERAIWIDDFVCGAGLDPAFEGGDRCMLRFGKCGQMTHGKTGIELGELVQIKTEASTSEPLHYQIVRQVKELCELHDPPVPPELFALDSTGEGGGLAAIFQREWSPAITLVEFGGRASDDPVSEFNPKPCSQEYLYKVTQLWYTFRLMVQNNLIRGLDPETAFEFCQRVYEMRGNLKMLESKKVMKLRTKKSPDLADSTVVLVDMFRQTQHLGTHGERDTPTDEAWENFVKANGVYRPHEKGYLIES